MTLSAKKEDGDTIHRMARQGRYGNINILSVNLVLSFWQERPSTGRANALRCDDDNTYEALGCVITPLLTPSFSSLGGRVRPPAPCDAALLRLCVRRPFWHRDAARPPRRHQRRPPRVRRQRPPLRSQGKRHTQRPHPPRKQVSGGPHCTGEG